MPPVERVTLIHPDGSDEVTIRDGFARDGSFTAVKIPLDCVPAWEQPGMDVVAAHADGTVESAFTVLHMDEEPAGADWLDESDRERRYLGE